MSRGNVEPRLGFAVPRARPFVTRKRSWDKFLQEHATDEGQALSAADLKAKKQAGQLQLSNRLQRCLPPGAIFKKSEGDDPNW